MSNEQFMTIRGRLTGEPELRFLTDGTPVAGFTIAANARTFDKRTNDWKDKETIFWRCTAWRELAENVTSSLVKGTAVVALVELEARSYEKDGEKRTVTEAKVEAIGPDLRWATATVTRAGRKDAAPAGSFGNQAGTATPGGWNSPDGNGGGGWANSAASEVPPF